MNKQEEIYHSKLSMLNIQLETANHVLEGIYEPDEPELVKVWKKEIARILKSIHAVQKRGYGA